MDQPSAPSGETDQPLPPENPPPASTDKADTGCLVLLGAVFLGIFLIPAAIMLGGAPVIIPALAALLAAVVTPLLNPAEKMSSSRARWTGRILVFLTLCALAGGAALFIWRGMGDFSPVPE